MPLTHLVRFKAVIGRGNRIQIPRLIRWEFKFETAQLLKGQIYLFGRGVEEIFYVKMNKDGRITVPKLNASLIKRELGDEESIYHQAFEITLEPG
jgi:hypothetical protein